MRDVAIAGGGPAGSACAALLAHDHDVTVFEDHPTVGRPVQCAGLITDETIRMSGVSPGILSTLYGAEVFFPDGGSVSVRSDAPKARTVDRSEFDSLLADRAISAGAEYRTGERMTSHTVTDRVEVSTVKGTEGFRMLIGADGHSSKVAASIPDNAPTEYIRGVQADVRVHMDDQERFIMRLGSRYAPGFFTWEIPCGDITRVGLCTSWSAGPPMQYLKRMLSDLGYDNRVETMHCGRIPLGRCRTLTSDRVMLIGDSAVQVKPISGGGLYPIFKAAPLLADVAHGALENDDLSASYLSKYDRSWKDIGGSELRSAYRLRRMFLRLDDEDMSRAGRYASRDDVRSVLDGIDLDHPSNVVSGILRHPGAALSGFWTVLRCLI